MYNIINACKDRETALLGKADQKVPPVRNIFANYTGFLLKNLEKFDFDNRKYNLYYSLARYDQIKVFSFSPKVRAEQGKEWNKVFLDHMKSMDIGLDFDAPSHEEWRLAYEDCKLVKKYLDEYKVPYSIKWSGSKGFHIRIPYHALPDHLVLKDDRENQDAVSLFIKSFGELISMMFGGIASDEIYDEYHENLKTLDLGVFDYRRVWKTDYSWVCETDLISLPLSDEQFDNFDLQTVKPENVLKSGVRNRFDLMRVGGKEEFKKFCEEVLGMEW